MVLRRKKGEVEVHAIARLTIWRRNMVGRWRIPALVPGFILVLIANIGFYRLDYWNWNSFPVLLKYHVLNDEDPWEEERSWRDPSAHNLRSVVIDLGDLTRRKMKVSFIFTCSFLKREHLIVVLNLTSQIKNVLMPNHMSTGFWLPSASVPSANFDFRP